MKNKNIYVPYNVTNPNANSHSVNYTHDIIRVLLQDFKKEKGLIWCAPLSDNERIEFETRIVRAQIGDNDTLPVAYEKYTQAREFEPVPMPEELRVLFESLRRAQ